MYQNCCKKCGSISLHTEVKGNNTGLYCDDCGAWVKWLGKDELRAFEHANKSRGLRATAKLYDDAFVYNPTDDENISDCLIIGFDKQNYETNHTNADRIRNMSDDELAVFLTKFKNTFGEEYDGEKSCLDWLKERS